MPQVKITIDEEEKTVDVPLEAITLSENQRIVTNAELAQHYIPVAQTQGDDAVFWHRDKVAKRYKNYINRSKATSDEEIVAQVMAEHGEAFKDQTLEEAKGVWKKAEVDPLLDRIATLEAKDAEREAQLVRSAIDAASARVWRQEFAQKAPDGGQSWAQVNFAGVGMWSPAQGEVIATKRDEQGNRAPIAAIEPTLERPHMPIEEYMRTLSQEDRWKPFALPPEMVTTTPGGLPSGAGAPGEKPYAEWTTAEKIAYMKKHGGGTQGKEALAKKMYEEGAA